MSTAIDTTAQDVEHLRLLSIFHWVLAGILALFSLFPVFHLIIGVFIVTGEFDDGNPPPPLMGWLFIGFASAFIVAGLAFSACVAHAARCLQRRIRPTYCLVIAGLSCLFMPLGTVLGVFTLITLLKPSVQALFAAPAADA
jgi:hypothetical protein